MASVDSKDGRYSETHEFVFTEKRWYMHVTEVMARLPAEAPAFTATALALWGISEVLMAVLANRVPLHSLAGPVLLVSLANSVYRAWAKHRSYVPDALKEESAVAQSIYWRMKCGWQVALARQLLTDRISDIDRTLERVARGTEFLAPKRLPLEQYISWLQDRPEVVQRLLHAVAVLCTSDLPRVLGRADSGDKLCHLVMGVNDLVVLYRHMERFERECHEVIPPPQFEYIHSLTLGWSKPVRDGVHRFMAILEELSSIDSKEIMAGKAKFPSFNISFDAPANVSAFCQGLEAINVTGAA